MMTSSNGNIFRVTGPLCGEFTTQRPVTRSFDVFFDLRLNKRLSKQPWGWWFETLSWSLWRHCNVDQVSRQWQHFLKYIIDWKSAIGILGLAESDLTRTWFMHDPQKGHTFALSISCHSYCPSWTRSRAWDIQYITWNMCTFLWSIHLYHHILWIYEID